MSELYELPTDWEWTEWKSIVNVKNGKDYKSVLNENGLYPIYGSGGVINYANEYLCNENTVIIGRKGTINSPIFVKEKFWNIDTAFGLEAKIDKLTPFFLYYFTLSFNFLTLNKSTTLPGLAKSNLQKILMPLPPLQEQKRIVVKLDTLFEKIDKSIALHQKNMDEADVFMGSVLNDVFGELEEKHNKVKLSTVIRIIGGGTPSKKEKTYCDNGTIKWATVGDMNVETIINTELSITEDGLKNSSSNIIPKEAIIIATRVGLGKVCYLNDDTAINQDLKGLLPLTDKLNIRFLFNYFKNIKEFIISNGTGATVKGVKLDFVRELLLPFPPLNIQQKVVAHLDEISKKIEKIKSVQKEKMESLVALKASILDQAFKGEL
ncbi:MAG: hypothetical protein DRG78_11290 [Epsilonproteobacteria bacterium]|nr:MAG: hypothetical protein DRG78_11290 [Campylobacterota bacterium]